MKSVKPLNIVNNQPNIYKKKMARTGTRNHIEEKKNRLKGKIK